MQKKTMFPFVFSLICTNFADKSTKKELFLQINCYLYDARTNKMDKKTSD